jgi:hypothetical protein
MCNEPVTFGGGSKIIKGAASGFLVDASIPNEKLFSKDSGSKFFSNMLFPISHSFY